MPVEYKETVECIEGHNAGMPVKVVFLPFVHGSTMLEKKDYCQKNLDHIRKMLTYEPRSGGNSYGVVVTKPADENAHFGAIYFDPSGWHDMCGHATMFLGSLAMQRHLLQEDSDSMTKVDIDTPAGPVSVHVKTGANGEVDRVSLINVPSFVHSVVSVNVKKLGKIPVTIAFGGDFYGIVDLDSLGYSYTQELLPELSALTKEIFSQLGQLEVVHPTNNKIRGIYGIRYHSRTENGEIYGVLFFGDGKRVSLDRSPSGTSSSAHLAYLYFKERSITLNQGVTFLSAIATRFNTVLLSESKEGNFDAVLPEISSVDKACFITGFSTYVIDSEDPMGAGFKPLEPF